MGGGLVVRTAAAVPNRVGAGASFHGGGLVTNMPNSPHLLAPKIKARMYFGIASNDDMAQPDAKDKLREAFAAAKVPAEIEVYLALHGWCVPDMPLQSGKPIYSKPDAERAWGKLVALYETASSPEIAEKGLCPTNRERYTRGTKGSPKKHKGGNVFVPFCDLHCAFCGCSDLVGQSACT